MKYCPNNSCPHLKRHGIESEFLDSVVVCLDCGTLLRKREAPAILRAVYRDEIPESADHLQFCIFFLRSEALDFEKNYCSLVVGPKAIVLTGQNPKGSRILDILLRNLPFSLPLFGVIGVMSLLVVTFRLHHPLVFAVALISVVFLIGVPLRLLVDRFTPERTILIERDEVLQVVYRRSPFRLYVVTGSQKLKFFALDEDDFYFSHVPVQVRKTSVENSLYGGTHLGKYPHAWMVVKKHYSKMLAQLIKAFSENGYHTFQVKPDGEYCPMDEDY